MAYKPKDDEEQQTGMNVFGQQPQQNQQQGAQEQPQNVSGGQSTTIGGGQAQQGSQGQSQAPKSKQAKSGMFTNIRKYIDQNKAGAQSMSGKLQSNVSQQNQNIQQAIGKQKTDFMSRVNQNRQRMNQAQQFGQQTLQSAQTQESQPMLQQQQQDTQQRVDQFGDVSDQTQNINQYTGQVTDQEGLLAQQQNAYRQAQQAFQNQAQQFGQMLDPSQVATGDRVQQGWTRNGQNTQLPNMVSRYYQNSEALQNAVNSGDQELINNVDDALKSEREVVSNLQQIQNQNGYLDQYQARQLQDAQDKLNSFQSYRNQLSTQQQALQQQTQAQTQLESLRDGLSRSKEQQRLYQNKTNLQNELTQIQDRIQNAPESLTEDDITRFNNLRTGIERFDSAILNLSEQNRQVQDLTGQTQALETSQGRRGLMRQEFGRQGGYTSGQAALDNLVLTGDQNAMRELVQNSQAQAQQAQDTLQAAFKEGRITQDEMARGTRDIQKNLEEGVQTAQTALQQGLEERARTGEGTYIKELQDKLASGQGLTAEDMNILSITGQERFNQDPTQLLQNLQIDPEQYGIQDVANLTDVARADALARLSGEDKQTMLLNEDQIRQRNLRGEGDQFTRDRSELSSFDREAVRDFVGKLKSGQVFTNPEQARQEIKNSSLTKYSLGPIARSLQHLVETGSTGTHYGNVSLDDILAGDERALGLLQNLNYWTHVSSTGQHGVVTNPDDIKRAVAEAYAKTQAMKSAYSGAKDNALRSENESAYIQQAPVDWIKT
jgi:hypothetical protein